MEFLNQLKDEPDCGTLYNTLGYTFDFRIVMPGCFYASSFFNFMQPVVLKNLDAKKSSKYKIFHMEDSLCAIYEHNFAS